MELKDNWTMSKQSVQSPLRGAYSTPELSIEEMLNQEILCISPEGNSESYEELPDYKW